MSPRLTSARVLYILLYTSFRSKFEHQFKVAVAWSKVAPPRNFATAEVRTGTPRAFRRA